MLFQWIVAIIAVGVLVLAFYSDHWTGKKKHSEYFRMVQKTVGKAKREAIIPATNGHDSFYNKLNTLD